MKKTGTPNPRQQPRLKPLPVSIGCKALSLQLIKYSTTKRSFLGKFEPACAKASTGRRISKKIVNVLARPPAAASLLQRGAFTLSLSNVPIYPERCRRTRCADAYPAPSFALVLGLFSARDFLYKYSK